MKFHFELAPVDGIAPWTMPSRHDRKHLHWFGLSDGSYWVEIDGHRLLRYSDAVCQHWATSYPEASGSPYVEYQVVRLWEDVLQMLPAVLEPVPEDLARLVCADGPWGTWQRTEDWADRARTWYEALDGDEWEAYYQATGWWGERRLDSGYLRAGFGLWLWRVGDAVHVRWDNEGVLLDGIPAWAETFGEAALGVTEFVDAVRDFDARFLAAMGERVALVRAHWGRPNVEIDVDALEREQQERATWLGNALGPASSARQPDWDGVRAAVARIERETT